VGVTAGRFAGFCNEADQLSKGPALERKPSEARLGPTGMPCWPAWRMNGAQAGLLGPLPLESGTRLFRFRSQGTMPPNLIAITRPAA
jgi:hypothetical protein